MIAFNTPELHNSKGIVSKKKTKNLKKDLKKDLIKTSQKRETSE